MYQIPMYRYLKLRIRFTYKLKIFMHTVAVAHKLPYIELTYPHRCSGSVKFLYGSGFSEPYRWITDPIMGLFFSYFKDVNKNLAFQIFLLNTYRVL